MNLQMFADDPQNTDREEERTEEPKKSDPPERGGNQKQKEEVPQWAQNLQKSLDTLNANLSSLIGSSNKETKPSKSEPQTIPVPKPPKTETTPQESKGSKSSEKTGLQKLLDFLM